MTVGVMGCVRTLPVGFPIEKTENAGNMVHGNAPFRIFDNAILSSESGIYKSLGYKSFVDFVNQNCTHLILTLANTLKLGEKSLPNLERMSTLLEKIQKPVVTFGLGGQSQTDSVDDQILAPEAIKLVRTISERTELLGVRGEITEDIIRKKTGVKNVFVTGCPSLFSRPEGIKALRGNLASLEGRPSFNGTKFHMEAEKELLWNAINRDQFLVEPVNRFNHDYHVAVAANSTEAEIPYFIKRYIGDRQLQEIKVEKYYRENYRLFRSTEDWFAFNSESVSYSYGSRFHVNMASILSGKPALWLTHDSRTRELVEYMNLPNVEMSNFAVNDDSRLDWVGKYERFFRGFPEVRSRFEHYLKVNRLPAGAIRSELFG